MVLKRPTSGFSQAIPGPSKNPTVGVHVKSLRSMDTRRTKTLEALATFVESQKALLVRTQSDIARLKELRQDISSLPDNVGADSISAQLDPSLFRLSELPGLVPAIDREIDWSLFNPDGRRLSVLACVHSSYADAAPLKELATRSRNSYAQSRQPSAHQQSALSPLQQTVKDYRTNVLGPVLAAIPIPPDTPSESEDNVPDPEEQTRARERAKILQLQKRRVDGGAPAPVFAGLGLRPCASNSVFVRRDQDDESAEVDIALDDVRSTAVPGSSSEVPMEVDTPPTSLSRASPASVLSGLPPSQPLALGKPVRDRRPSRKAQEKSGAVPSRDVMPKAKSKAAPEPEVSGPPAPPSQKLKPKSETYKQAWSVSEQHLLERLLDEIPEGEKNRWSKISRAMNGRRTARQVASRVQKYYEKLKRFGLEVGGNKSTE
ncbi:hypothetical protein B0H21DRAFT_108800 [Amylocystis lapponica]|nr:hypothetical protein B0H21DRAFT_108800 [Amylocystis lapponica]